MDERDSKKIIQLAREGKEISKICEEDFPQYDYWDVYFEVIVAGEKSSVGVKRMITNRLKKITSVPKDEQVELIDEINHLISHLYDRYKESQIKLDKIRNVINKNG